MISKSDLPIRGNFWAQTRALSIAHIAFDNKLRLSEEQVESDQTSNFEGLLHQVSFDCQCNMWVRLFQAFRETRFEK
jgi:hypothetical protein